MPKLLLIAFITILSTAYIIWDLNRAPRQTPITAKNQEIYPAAPDFTFSDINGKPHKLSDYKGQTIILNFWATWCPPCVAEFPDMIEKANQEGMILLALSVDQNPELIKPFFKKHKIDISASNIIIGLDTDKQISQQLFQTYKYPESYIITPEGDIKEKIIGATDWLAR